MSYEHDREAAIRRFDGARQSQVDAFGLVPYGSLATVAPEAIYRTGAASGQWYLVVDGWDSMASAWGDMVESRYPIDAIEADEAVRRGAEMYAALKRYESNGSEWPKRPRVIQEFILS